MSDNTGIEWTDATWNPIAGCSIVSAGCRDCYAMRMAARLEAISNAHMAKNGGDPGPLGHYLGTTKASRAGAVWTSKVNLAPRSIIEQPLNWKKPRNIFLNSMSDLFHENVPDRWIDQIVSVIARAPQHTYQILTKREARMKTYFDDLPRRIHDWDFHMDYMALPMPNVLLGVSVENQSRADERIPTLMNTPAAARFLSCEPLLGPLDISPYLREGKINWVIAGGESGPDARPAHPDWFRALRDQCAAAGVPFFFKQWGEWTPGENVPDLKKYPAVDGDFNKCSPDDWTIEADGGVILYKTGKKKAGNHLDGRQHLEFPQLAKVPA